MKITFFLIAFCLVFIRLYMGWTGHWRDDSNDGTMTSSNGDDDIELKWSGRSRLNENETAVELITPGGYLKFRHNDEKMAAESNLQGDITYELYDGQNYLTMDEKAKKFLAGIIHEMLEFGYDAEGRMDRIYKKGGKKALLDEEQKLRSEHLKGMYIDRLLKADSLTKEDLGILTTRIGELGPDFEKGQRLSRYSPDQLKDSGTLQAWLGVVDHMANDHDKSDLLSHLIEQDRIPANHFDRLLALIGHFRNDFDKESLYKKMIDNKRMTEGEWSGIIRQTEHLGSDFEKAEILVKIAKNMPPSDTLKTVYMKTAKTIDADQEYGKALRAIE
jgi:hypothetical protein